MEVIRHYPMPSAGTTCDECAGQCEAGKPCPREPIPTDYGDLEDDRHSTEAGAGFAVLLVVALSAIVFGVWCAATNGVGL